MINIEIDQKQLQDILKKADPAIVKIHIAELMKDAGYLGRAVAMKNLTGGFEQAKTTIRFDSTPMTAKVYSVMPNVRTLSIEEGRKPGEAVPYMQLARWSTRRRYLTQRRLSELSRDERARIESAREAILSSGTKPKHFLAGAREAILQKLPDMLNKIAKKIESGWGK